MHSYDKGQQRLEKLMKVVWDKQPSQESYQDQDIADYESDQEEVDHEAREEHHSGIEQDVSDIFFLFLKRFFSSKIPLFSINIDYNKCTGFLFPISTQLEFSK